MKLAIVPIVYDRKKTSGWSGTGRYNGTPIVGSVTRSNTCHTRRIRETKRTYDKICTWVRQLNYMQTSGASSTA